MKRGNLFILSAPSGAGKTTLLSSLISKENTITTSVSHTTRAPRGEESDGREYYFVSKPDFLGMVRNGEFLEYAEVFGNLYGTSKHEIAKKQNQGLDVVLEIDWQGAKKLMASYPEIISVFLLPPSLADLKIRLQKRGQDSQKSIETRLSQAESDMKQSINYQYVITNHTLEDSVNQLTSIIKSSSGGITI